MRSFSSAEYKPPVEDHRLRASLLTHDPQIGPVTMAMLVGIANAIERESLRRYEQLEQTMQRRGEVETAAAFRLMRDEELAHVESVGKWAASLGVPIPESAAFRWTLPADLSSSWDDIVGSALLTPYRAFAIAVENEQRAFSFYAYVAAHAGERSVAAEAERLAAEELRHAARVRRWRREAYHRERPAGTLKVPNVASADALRALLAERRASIVALHRAIAARLHALGDDESARLLEAFVAAHATAPDEQAPVAPGADTLARVDATSDPVHLLVAAQKPLEALGETLESILSTSEGELFAQAERAATDVVAWLARVSLQTERRIASAG